MKLQTQQCGVALLLVLIVLATTTLMGTAYLGSVSAYQAGAAGFADLARARCLAESAIEHGLYLLREKPLLLDSLYDTPLGPYTIDALGGSYTLRAVPTGEPGLYYLEGQGQFGRSKQTSVLLARRAPETPAHEFKHALLMQNVLAIVPASVQVEGPVHVNGVLVNYGKVIGQSSATGAMLNFGLISPAPHAHAQAQTIPVIEPGSYYQYVYENKSGKALICNNTQLRGNDPFASNKAVTASNPAGVVVVRPNNHNKVVVTQNNFTFRGTMIVEGDLRLDGNNVTFDALPGFPALIVTGHLIISNPKTSFSGVVYARRGVVTSGNTNGSGVSFEGTLVCPEGGISILLNGYHTITYDAEKAFLVPPTGASVPPVELVRWE